MAKLEDIIASGVRSAILGSLLRGPKTASELASQLDTRQSSALHAMRPLIEDATIGRKAGASRDTIYHLTGRGRIRSALTAQLETTESVLNEYADFWQSHDLSGIPDFLLAGIGKLAGGKCILGNDSDPLKSQEFFIREVSKARRVWGVSPIIAPGYTDLVSALLDRGAEVVLVLTDDVIHRISDDILGKWNSYPDFNMRSIECAKVAFTIADDCLFLGLVSARGSYDAMSDLVVKGPDAVAWGTALFGYFRGLSRP